MLDVANHVARTQNVSPAAEVELKSDLAPVAAEVAGDLHDLRRQHAERFTQQMLGLANTDPVVTTQQNVEVPNGEVALTTDLARGLNAQATANAQMTAQQMRGMGFTEEAIQRTNELVRHHSVAGDSATQVSQVSTASEPQGSLTNDPRAQEQAISEPAAAIEQEQATEREPQAIAQEIGQTPDRAQDLDSYMAELQEAVSQDRTIPEPDRVQEPLDDQMADPLADSKLMVEVDEPVAVSAGEMQQTALTSSTEQMTAEIATERADKAALDLQEAQSQSLAPEMMEPEAQAETRFDYRPTAAKSLDLEAEAMSLEPAAREKEERDEEVAFSFVNPLQQQAVAQAAQTQAAERATEVAAEPFKLAPSGEREFGRTEREGRARVTYLAAA